MTDEDSLGFTETITLIFTYYGKPFDAAMAGLYFDLLADYSLGAVEQAFKRHLADPERGQFWPKAADIVRIVQGGTGAKALRAWDAATAAISSVSSWRSVTFEDRLINQVISEMGGWIAFCDLADDYEDDLGQFHRGNRQEKQRNFVARYEMAMAWPPSDPPAKLSGRCEIANRESKWANDERAEPSYLPVLIATDGAVIEPTHPTLPAWTDPGRALPNPARPLKNRSGMELLGTAMRRATERRLSLKAPTAREIEATQTERERQKRALGGPGA